MRSKRRGTQVATAAKSDCRHYWIIDTSQHNESRGRCQLCGEERTFQNKVAFPNKKPNVVTEELPDEDAPPPGSVDSSDTAI